MNLREFIDVLDRRGHLVKIRKPVDVKYEAATLMKMLDGKPILFENIKGHSMPVVANICSSRELVAIGLGVKREELMGKLADAIDHPGLYRGLLGLICADTLTPEKGTAWREAWLNTLKTVGKEPDCPFDLHPYRRAYYLEAYDALLGSEFPQTALWPLLDTWLQAITVLWKNENQRKAWIDFCSDLGFTPDCYVERVKALDAFLDNIDLTLDNWKSEYGL